MSQKVHQSDHILESCILYHVRHVNTYLAEKAKVTALNVETNMSPQVKHIRSQAYLQRSKEISCSVSSFKLSALVTNDFLEVFDTCE